MPGRIAYAVFDLVHRITTATSIADVWSFYMSAARPAGLEFGIACFLPNDKSIAETTFANSMPEHWLENYARQGHHEHDLVERRALMAAAPFQWAMTEYDPATISARELSWRDDNRAAGVERGISIPDRRNGSLKAIALAGPAGDFDPDDLRTLHYAGLEALMRMHELGLRSEEEKVVALSPRERECLQWITAGKSDWEIGQILAISEKTVNTHVERVKHKLGVTTRAQMIVTALRHGLINP